MDNIDLSELDLEFAEVHCMMDEYGNKDCDNKDWGNKDPFNKDPFHEGENEFKEHVPIKPFKFKRFPYGKKDSFDKKENEVKEPVPIKPMKPFKFKRWERCANCNSMTLYSEMVHTCPIHPKYLCERCGRRDNFFRASIHAQKLLSIGFLSDCYSDGYGYEYHYY